MHIGGYFIDNPIALAPMAGITDKPFRRICREFGAGWAVCEMLTSDPTLRHTKKTKLSPNIFDEYRCKNPQQNFSHPNPINISKNPVE